MADEENDQHNYLVPERLQDGGKQESVVALMVFDLAT